MSGAAPEPRETQKTGDRRAARTVRDRRATQVVRDRRATQVVPGSGQSAWLTLLTAAAMAFLCVFALALALAADRLADRWQAALAQTATVRIAAPAGQIKEQTAIVLEVLATTPGVQSARVIGEDEQAALLEPWFGPDLPMDALTLPRLVEVIEAPGGVDSMGLRLRLAAEAPGAILDDHTRWRRPLIEGAARLRLLALASIGLIGGVTAAMVTLAAMAALATNARVIAVLRLVGARDSFIARAFVRRFTLRTLIGAAAGVALGMVALWAMPEAHDGAGLLTGIGLRGIEWLYPLAIPPVAALVAWAATRAAAFRVLREVT